MLVFGTEGTISLNGDGATLTRPAVGSEGGGKEDDSERFTTERPGRRLLRGIPQLLQRHPPRRANRRHPGRALKDWELIMRAINSAEGREVILL